MTNPRPNPETVPEIVPGFPELIPIGEPTQLPSSDVPYTQIPYIPDSQFHITSYGDSVAPQTSPEFHPGPPGPGVRERKVRVSGTATVLRGLNAVTESLDFIEALWWALPQQYRTPYARPHQKVIDLYNHIEHINVREAVTNAMVMQFQDMAFGRASQIANTHQFVDRGIPIGNLVGPAI